MKYLGELRRDQFLQVFRKCLKLKTQELTIITHQTLALKKGSTKLKKQARLDSFEGINKSLIKNLYLKKKKFNKLALAPL